MGQELMFEIISVFPMPALVVSGDNRIVATNNAATQALGSELTGLNYVTALRQPALISAVEKVQNTGVTQNVRYTARDGGRDTLYDVTLSRAGDNTVLVLKDVSAVAEVSKFRRDFVANVSHELRTPLTALLGFIETLQGPARNDPTAQQRFLTVMAQEADRMRRLVDDLLSLSRVEEEERVRPNVMVDLAGLVPSVLAGLEPIAAQANMPLVHQRGVDPLFIPADDVQLRQVINNLISNAIKYGASEKGVEVTVSGPTYEPSIMTEGVRIAVNDFGEGIAAHHIARLTERFYRVDTHRAREVGGTGLGLAIVKHIVSRHRGRMTIESTLGQGATFTLILPAILS
jgi:two-component system phosphate regulon sensor histidine kinase PhoR